MNAGFHPESGSKDAASSYIWSDGLFENVHFCEASRVLTIDLTDYRSKRVHFRFEQVDQLVLSNPVYCSDSSHSRQNEFKKLVLSDDDGVVMSFRYRNVHRNTAQPDELVTRFLSHEDTTMADSIIPPEEDPESAWAAILLLTKHDLSDEQTSSLAAGPVEELLAWHGEKFIGRVEAEAKNNPAFARVLLGVWRNRIPLEIWRRVESARAGVTW